MKKVLTSLVIVAALAIGSVSFAGSGGGGNGGYARTTNISSGK
jgi:hypothetical protein